MGIRLVMGKSGASAMIQLFDEQVGSMVASPEVMLEVAKRIGDDTSAAIRERCYSLVQSVAKCRPTDNAADMAELLETFEAEAIDIARDAGW